MSLEALNRALKSPQPSTRKLVLILMANRADEWGYVYAGAEYFASLANISVRSVRRIIKDLLAAQEIRLVRRGGGRGNKQSDGTQKGEANVYQVIIGLTPEEIALSEQLSDLAREVDISNGDKMTPFNGDKLSPQTLNTAAVNTSTSTREKAAAIVKGDKMSPLPPSNGDKMTPLVRALAKFGHGKVNGDKMTPLVSLGERLLQAGWQGSWESLAQLVLGANERVFDDADYPLETALADAQELGWRGSVNDLIEAWVKDPARVENLLWYARQKGWGAGLLRTALRSGEWPPELKPGSESEMEVWRKQAQWLAELQGEGEEVA